MSLPLLLAACALPPAATPPQDVDVAAPPTEPSVPPVAEPEAPDEEPATPARAAVPIFGGTLLVADGMVYSADPENDRVLALDAAGGTAMWVAALPGGSLPFRLASNGDHVFTSLRGNGSIARIDSATGAILGETAVCPEPRGLAWDDDRALLWVACASGELVSLNADGIVLASTLIQPDLRDVVALPERVAVSVFRTAEVLFLDPDTAAVIERVTPPDLVTNRGPVRASGAWRMIAGDSPETLALAHQVHSLEQVDIDDDQSGSAYGGTAECDGIVEAAVTRLSASGVTSSSAVDGSALPVDLALTPTGALRLAAAGASTVATLDTSAAGPCVLPVLASPGTGFPVGVATDASGLSIVQVQSPYALFVEGTRLTDPTLDGAYQPVEAYVAVDAFHGVADAGIACAGCHPEGQDDGVTWRFKGLGARRTQNLAGGLSQTAPYHWDAEFTDLDTLMDDVFVGRMGGVAQGSFATEALLAWLDGVPPVATTQLADAALVATGRELFASEALACATCHAGARYTSPESYDVGTGNAFQVPSLLGVGSRGPWMHTGCATTLDQRFTDLACGGATHGGVVPTEDVPALVAYLNTL